MSPQMYEKVFEKEMKRDETLQNVIFLVLMCLLCLLYP